MNHLLNISRSGINGLQQKLDVTAHNLANVNTAGYKRKTLQFRELLNNPIANQAPVNENANPAVINRGVEGLVMQDLWQQGSFLETGNPWHFAIEGDGFFGVRDANNQLLLTRAGAFGQDETGRLVNQQGEAVEMTDFLPSNQWPKGEIHVTASGAVSIVHADQQTPVGQIRLYQPTDFNALVAVGENHFQVNPGTALVESLQGSRIRQGSLEQSTVDVAQSMSDMLVTQRAYSLNTRALQSTDEMFSTINRFTE
ncbi:flagellar hook-basal body protein [Enterococcus sp. LJL98]